jgi:hypothetical protein
VVPVEVAAGAPFVRGDAGVCVVVADARK